MVAPYLRGVRIEPDRVPAWDAFPFDLPFVRDLDLRLRAPVTFFVGENGSGKSTLLEGLAAKLKLPTIGSASVEQDETLIHARRLSAAMKLIWNGCDPSTSVPES